MQLSFRRPEAFEVESKERFLSTAPDTTVIRWISHPKQRVSVQDALCKEAAQAPTNQAFSAYLHAPHYTTPGVSFDRIANCRFYPRAGGFLRLDDNSFHETTRVGTWSNSKMTGVRGVEQDESGQPVVQDISADSALRTVEGPHLICSHTAWCNFGHFVLDCLPAVLPFLPELQSGTVRLATAPLWYGWQRKFYALLGVPESAIVEVSDEEVLFRDAILPSCLSAAGTRHPHRLAASVFRRLLVAAEDELGMSGGGQRLAGPRMFLRRTTKRILRDQDVLERRLEDELGFTAISPEDLQITEQAVAFAAAECVVGVFGASFTNIGFCAPGTKILEIRSNQSDDPWAMHLAALQGLRYACAIADLNTAEAGWTVLGDRPYMDHQVLDKTPDSVMAQVRELLQC